MPGSATRLAAENFSQADSDRSWGDLRRPQPLDQAKTVSLDFHPDFQLGIVTRWQSEATKIRYFSESDVWKRAKKLKRLGFSGPFPDFAIPAKSEISLAVTPSFRLSIGC